MKTLKYIIFLLTLALTGLSLTGCNSEDNLNTDPYGNDISVLSFGPCPVLRGGTLHFLGSNLDQIAEIDLPGADPITQYEVVKAGQESEITIQVPAEKCDTGIVVLKTRKGGVIRTITPRHLSRGHRGQRLLCRQRQIQQDGQRWRRRDH